LKGKGKDTTSVTTEKDLRTQLRELDIYKLQEHAGEDLLGAQMVNSSYNLERTTGSRKFGSRLQNFFTSFSEFLTAYSGIIELVRNAGQQYGEAAYQTLSILLTVRSLIVFFLFHIFAPETFTDRPRWWSTKTKMTYRSHNYCRNFTQPSHG